MELTIPDVRIINLGEDPETFDWYRANSLEPYGLPDLQNQDEVALEKGGIFGVHLQTDPLQTLVFRIVHGEMLVVLADLRFPHNVQRRHWKPRVMDVVLSDKEDRKLLCIPPGCAQGIQALQSGSILYRLADRPFEPRAQLGVNWRDGMFGGIWKNPEKATNSLFDAELPQFTNISTAELPVM